ncbi:hypothetical protein E7W39_03815 [Cronobacter sakazakii]|uniref:Uncharacterized protein n=2 Tax=Enterobacteriaceae TaxID=543 RepID=A0A0J8VNI4_9ENTR|nr:MULTISPECIES: hypothetical protein [Enterobacteriaceae]EGT4277868.1 hypothetical protein [Cronobacter sakazakii]EGT5666967.1 hypothetical protein [Cronobacter sakazakii]EGZ7002232.1 hypothetical protein [Cronobacter sakazakii]EGZ7011455.1 hypothetical protein [Cronobacter sakazakii]EGZ7015554.1 hypothetical protein [Cronobacter sakazakii]
MNINRLVALFFWGMVAKCLSELMDVSVLVTQGLLKWCGYGLWILAVLFVAYDLLKPRLQARRHKREAL